MNTKMIVYLFAAALLTNASFADGQQPKKVPLIGYLSGVDPTTDLPRAEGIRRALRDLGYIDGQNIAFQYRHTEDTSQPQHATELVRLKVDLIVVAGRRQRNPAGYECDEDDSHYYDGAWVRSSQSRIC